MSLRSQIHHAIDDVAPPAPTLERRVRAFVLSDDRDRTHLTPRPQPRWVAPLGLIAAALVLALVAGLFIGGRFWRSQNAPPSTVGQNELKSLESRPLNFPNVGSGVPCPGTPEHLNQYLGMVYGDGPVFIVNIQLYGSSDWGGWAGLHFAYHATKPGLVLIRARDLESSAEFAFANYPLSPTGITAVGPVLGQAHVLDHDLRLRSEAVFHDPWSTAPMDKQGDLPPLIALGGLQRGGSGCIGLQFDGPTFTENIVLGH
jgi:hypothetical protein